MPAAQLQLRHFAAFSTQFDSSKIQLESSSKICSESRGQPAAALCT
jgi:hypothetical protein